MSQTSLRFFLVLAFVLPAHAAPPAGERDGLARDCVSLLEQGRFKEAARLFHYPPDYDQGELKNDRYQVAQNLRDLTTEFGALSAITVFRDAAAIRDLGTRGGDYAYWRDHPGGRSVYFRVRYAHAGEGFLKVQLVTLGERPEIGSVSFGIAADRSDAEGWILGAKQRLLKARRERPSFVDLAGV